MPTPPGDRHDRPRSGPRIILIGGTSHTGKSTVATDVSAAVDGQIIATDRLNRHPGRPWTLDRVGVHDHLRAHFADHSPIELLEALVGHYARSWPSTETVIAAAARVRSEAVLVVEGSGLLPRSVASARFPGRICAVWLTAPSIVRARRIRTAAHYAHQSSDDQIMIDRFVDRSELYDQWMRAELAACGRGTHPVIDDQDQARLVAALVTR